MENKTMQEYNTLIKRHNAAEEYFKTKTVEECLEALELFNAITRRLSELRKEIEPLLGREMTEDEVWNGFEKRN